MTFRQHTTDELNAAINIAARQMTTTPSSPELRARVMARIAVQSRWGWGWRLAFAGGAIGAAALTAAVMWPTQPTAVPALVDVAATAAPAAAPIALREVVTASDSVVVPMPQRAAQAFAVTTSELEWHARSVPALAEPDALHVAPLLNTELTVAPIEIAPLSVPPLATITTGAGGSK